MHKTMHNAKMNATKIHFVVRQIEDSMAKNQHTQTSLSSETGIPQSTLSRALSRPKRITKTHQKLCKFLGIALASGYSSSGAASLRQVVVDVWDGTDRHAEALTSLLKVARELSSAGSSVGKQP